MDTEQLIKYIRAAVPMDFYANDFPREAKDDCGYVRKEGAQPPNIYIPGLKSIGIQIVVRHKDEASAEAIAKHAWDLFHIKEHYFIGDYEIKFSSCNQSEPLYVGSDKNGRTIYSVNVTCHFVARSN